MEKRHRKRIILPGLCLFCAMLFWGCAFVDGSGRGAAGGVTESAEDSGSSDFAKLYYYAALSDDQRMTLYREIFTILTDMGQDVTVSCRDEALLDEVFRCVLADHPELFYVTGYTYTKYTKDSEVVQISFSGTYSMTKEEIERCQGKIDEYVESCLAGMPREDDYAKIRYLYEYLIRNTEYSLQAPENQNMCSVFLYGQSVCQGYAKAFQYLCGRAGIYATLVTGRIRESGYGHAWNLVRSDGAYYYVDTTWGDASYTMNGQVAKQGSPSVSYEYLCVTTDQINRTHEIDTVVGMPDCTSLKDNYYVRQNAYFTEFDEALLSELFDQSREAYVTFQCQSEEVYRQYEEYLIGQERIFDYMDSPSGISYSDNEETLTFGFWPPEN